MARRQPSALVALIVLGLTACTTSSGPSEGDTDVVMDAVMDTVTDTGLHQDTDTQNDPDADSTLLSDANDADVQGGDSQNPADTDAATDAATDTAPLQDTAPAIDTQNDPDADSTSSPPPELAGALALTTVDVATAEACVPLTIVHEGTGDGVAAVMIYDGDAAVDQYADWGCGVVTSEPVLAAGGTVMTYVRAPQSEVLSVVADEASGEAWVAAAAGSFAQDERGEVTVVVYNVNAAGADVLASAYASARSVPQTQVCGVALPRGQFASAAELMGARDTLLVDCLCPLVFPGGGCADLAQGDGAPWAMVAQEQIVAEAGVTHLALMRGLPPRLTQTGWASDDEEPGFDYYLSYALANDVDLFSGTSGIVSVTSTGYSPWGQEGPVSPAEHGGFAFSRLEAYTLERTLMLLDRTLASEAQGFRGRVVSEREPSSSPAVDPIRFAVDSLDPVCTDYLSHEPFVSGAPESTWPAELCRWGTTGSSSEGSDYGMMPGYQSTTVPAPVDISWFLGTEPLGNKTPTNNHAAFRHFNTMLKWRKTAEECTPLCDDLEGDDAQAACHESSADVFGVLNSDCVGVAEGFMGQQVRSFPVQYFGFYPEGWTVSGGGNSEKTAPRIFEEGGYQDPLSEESCFARFGEASPEAPNTDTCVIDDEEEACPERVVVNMSRTKAITPALVIDGERPIEVRFRYRNQASPGAYIRIKVCINDCGTGASVYYLDADGEQPDLELDEGHADWTLASFVVRVDQGSFDEITKLRLWFNGMFSHEARGFFDMDQVEVIDVETGAHLLAGDYGAMGFSDLRYQTNYAGGSAATVIDRMGGIAYWGSSSHFSDMGYAFPVTTIAGKVFRGHTLGQALFHSSARSGLAYGDPLYRGYAARLYTANREAVVPPSVLQLYANNEAGSDAVLLDVLQGTANLDTVRWELDTCLAQNILSCADWEPWLVGVGAARAHPVTYQALLARLPEGEDALLRLRVYPVDRPEDHLSAYAGVMIHAEPYLIPAGCEADLNLDGVVNALDMVLLTPFMPCSEEALTADFDGNGWVGEADLWVIFDAWEAGDAPDGFDLDGDGDLDLDDVALAADLYCGDPSPDDALDFNGDGAVDGADLTVMDDAQGVTGCSGPN